MTKRILLVGYGNWGKKIYQKLKKKFIIDIIKDRKQIKKNNFLKRKYDLVIVSCSTINHLRVIQKIPKINKKIFCEKPLTYKFSDAKKLFQVVKRKKQLIYISDIENLKKLKIKFYKENTILRFKNKRYSFYNLLYSLVYHDIYLHQNKLIFNEIQNLKILRKTDFFQISFFCKKKFFKWKYYLNSKKNYHSINKIKISSKKDFILPMINQVIKNTNFKKNNLTALYTIRILEKLYKGWLTKKYLK